MVISASTGEDADTKMKALKILASKLSATELKKLGEIVEKDPAKVNMAKSVLGL